MSRQYLIRRNQRYHFRMRVPQNLRPLFGCKEIHRSLKTSDRRAAESLAQAFRGKVEAAFSLLNQQILLEIDPAQIQVSARLALARGLPTSSGQASDNLALPVTNSRDNEFGQTTLKDLIAAFIEDREIAWAPKTTQMNTTALRQFVKFVGNKPVGRITRGECRAFKQVLIKLPPNWHQRFKGWPIEKILAERIEPMNPATANRSLSTLSAFFNWAVQENVLNENPARGLRVPNRHSPETERQIFSTDVLRLLFERSPVYAGCLSEKHRARPGTLIIRDARFWLPLIALYSGIRLEEIAQLRVDDVRQVEGVWVFDVNAAGENRLKTAHSARLVPIHPKLQKMQLLKYVTQAAKVGSDRLWPEFKKGTHGNYSETYSKWFGWYKRKVGITNPKVTFHSFRHTMINHLKQKDVPESRIKELVGHKDNSITMSRYGKRYEPRVMLETVKLLDYELDHAHLELTNR